MKADFCGFTCGQHYFLGICTAARIQGIDGAVGVSQLLDIYRSGSQIIHRDFTVCICGMGAGNEVRAAAVGVNAKFPARQVFSIFGGLGKV